MLQLILITLSWLLSSPGDGAFQTPAAVEVFYTEMLERVNTVRAEGCRCGNKRMKPAPPLRWNDRLEAAAARHARDMARRHFFDHTGSDGSSSGQRVQEAGYDWQTVGENIAEGYDDAATAIQGWFESPRHCRNIMNPEYREMGIAREGNYWVQTLAGSWEK